LALSADSRCLRTSYLRLASSTDVADACRCTMPRLDGVPLEQSRRDRKRAEMLFAHLKRILRLGRLRLRGPRGAQFEFTLAAIAQNLRRLAKLMARPPPADAACVAKVESDIG
jgi:hypothetical protein